MQRKTIAIAINSSWNIYNFRSGLVRALAGAGYQVLAIAPEDAHSARLQELGCRFVPVDMSARGTSPLEDAKLFLNYRDILKRHRPSAFLGYTIKPNVYGSLAAQSLNIPVINNIAGLGVTFLKPGFFQTFIRSLYRLALRRSHTVFFQNQDDRQLFVNAGLVQPELTELLPGSGVDLVRFAPADRKRGKHGRFSFLLVSRLLRSKGIAEYVAAAEAVRVFFPNAEFKIAGIIEKPQGDAVREDELQRWTASGAVTYLGALDDVRPALADADVVVLPTFYPEGTPRALLEAAAMAKPLIATNVPGCKAVLEHGNNGILIQPRDIGSLEDAMLRMLRMSDGELLAMGAASRRKAEAEFDERIVISRYLNAVQRALATRTA